MASTNKRTKTSLLWNYFEIDSSDGSKAICNYCNSSISRGEKNFNTTNMKKHLQSKHKLLYDKLIANEEVYREEQAKKQKNGKSSLDTHFTKASKRKVNGSIDAASSTPEKSQITIDETTKWDINSTQAHELHKVYDEFITVDFDQDQSVPNIHRVTMASTSKKAKTSLIWNYFKTDSSDDSKAICNYCKNSISRGEKSNTSNMKKHLRSKHKSSYDELVSEEEIYRVEQAKQQQKGKSSLDTHFTKASKRKVNGSLDTATSTSEKSQITIDETYAQSKKCYINSTQAQEIHKVITVDFDQSVPSIHCVTMKSTGKKTKTSLVWNYFEIDSSDDTKVICNNCKNSISRGGKNFNTTNMKKHLKSKHKSLYNKLVSDEELYREEQVKQEKKEKSSLDTYFTRRKIHDSLNVASSTSEKSWLTIDETYSRTVKWDINSTRAQEIHKVIGEFITLDCQPISVVEDLGFEHLMKKLKPNYVIPSRKYFSEMILPEIHKKVLKKVKDALGTAQNISFSTDIWTNNANNSFISLTGHCLNKNFELTTVVLRVAPFPSSHTATHIAEVIENVIQEFKIPTYKIHAIVHDNGANIVRAVSETGYNDVPCFLHTLQLVIHDILQQKIMKDIITKCKQIVEHFSDSPLAYKLVPMHLPQHNLIQDVPMQWNSTYFMLSRILEQKAAINSNSVDSNTSNMKGIDGSTWRLIDNIASFLKVFYEITVRLSKRNATVAEIIPQIKFLDVFLAKAATNHRYSGIASIISAMKHSIKRFEQYIDNYIAVLATYLDPRFKHTLYRPDYESFEVQEKPVKTRKANIESELKNALTKQMQMEAEVSEIGVVASTSEDDLDNKHDESSADDMSDLNYDTCLNQLINEGVECSKNSLNLLIKEGVECSNNISEKRKLEQGSHLNIDKLSKIKEEIARYEKLEMLPNNENPFQWWKDHEYSFPLLSQLANKYLCSPPSSIQSERLSSTNIHTPHRNRLNPDTGEMLMFLHYNMRIINFD
ncbi:zinc finger BED domain-containing protein 4-like [Palaemon carinicauda]|uniref:zinc finger BED domain-containing protein 4-like n=1 Tax=Palaemon carinicauda TaxID=392227 RepID=UPI0035B5F87A